MNEMPRVGAKIRVTRTYATGTIVIRQGVVTSVYDGFVQLETDIMARLFSDKESTVTWVELEPPKPALPAEPGFGLFVACGGDGNLLPFFRRWHEGWLRVDGDSSDYTTWPEICALSRERAGRDPVLLVPAPDLADMVILWRSDAAAYCDRVHGSGFDKCGNSVCADRRALMTKYETGATA